MPRIAGEARRRFPHAGWNLYGITFTAERHWAALEYAQNHSGVSARELVETFRRVNGTKRRPGETAEMARKEDIGRYVPRRVELGTAQASCRGE